MVNMVDKISMWKSDLISGKYTNILKRMGTFERLIPKSTREKVKKVLRENKAHVCIYLGFFVALLMMYIFVSSGGFSFLLTLSSLVSLLSFLILGFCIETTKSSKGISLETTISYVFVFFSRLMSILVHQGYLPTDSSGDYLYQLSEVLCLLFSVYIVFACKYKYSDTYERDNDKLKCSFILVPCFFLALFVHPSLNRFFLTDVCWAFALYVETVCVLPQLLMFQRSDKVVPAMAHFTAAQSLSKILSFVFWLSTYSELNSKGNIIKPFVGHWVIFTQLVQVLLVADFVVHYIKCITKGISVEFIMSDNV
ncbi:ER lumen protein retaining receptor 1, putative [Theileria annulata]|uniref:ER lumen protein retaining receptor 1, putative n=1 Tax=Theileria annulata TaxID=5874 RepID=Q4UC97_THEAN|nr:ER lumen protein retaining receptor 1, putative [Theileria annulata]CAI75554.1 ER lumen protein retaining receptor 1, putative [Theileria annulata]|eukprot:XP_955030.1 ER lumen protein retaining receptor 1, putative [Theileria annulata]